MIELEGISHRFRSRIALAKVHLKVAAGEKEVLLGTNGTGKSTLLRILDGLIVPVSGS